MRVTKDPVERKNEIIDTASYLFAEKGYNSVTIADLAKELDIAKGTIFYYFTSKEELLDAVFEKFFNRISSIANKIADDENLTAIEKLKKLTDINEVTAGDKKLLHFFETAPPPGNNHMILKRLVLFISSISPIITKIVKHGINEGTMQTKYPDEVAFMITALEKTIFLGLFECTHEELVRRMDAYLYVTEVILNLEEGTLDSLADNFITLTKILGV